MWIKEQGRVAAKLWVRERGRDRSGKTQKEKEKIWTLNLKSIRSNGARNLSQGGNLLAFPP